MIARIIRGHFAGGLLRYLYGPGRHEEHENPHLVASWDGHPEALEPEAGAAPGTYQVTRLARILSAPLALRRPPAGGHVWHCSLRAAPEDRALSDGEWADIARTVLDRTGIAPRGDEGACRWVAVRHGPDHIHVVAVLARQDGRPARVSFDKRRARDACLEVEARYGLRATAGAERVSVPGWHRGEAEKAARTGRVGPARDELRRRVRAAAVEACDPEAFVARLRGVGLLVHERRGQAGELTGYAVALPGDRNRDGEPVYYSGGRLAADLTLPQLSRRWTSAPPPPAASAGRPGAAARTATLTTATRAARQTAMLRLGEDGDGIAHAAADLMTAAARVIEGSRGAGPVTAAADRYDRAARSPWTPTPRAGPTARHLRTLSWQLAALRAIGGRDERAQAALLVTALADLAITIAAWRQDRQRTAQAYAAAQASHLLRTATPVDGGFRAAPPARPRPHHQTAGHTASPRTR